MQNLRTWVKVYSICAIIIAAFFWGWALLNTIKDSFDSGVIVFAIVFVAGIYGILATGENDSKLLAYSKWHSNIFITGVAFVCTAYAGALIFVVNGNITGKKKEHYFIIFGLPLFFWLTIGSYCGVLSVRYRKDVESSLLF